MYHLWNQRNAIIHARGFYTKEQLIRVIKKDVQGRIEGQMLLKDLILNCVLCCRWGINTAMLYRGPTGVKYL